MKSKFFDSKIQNGYLNLSQSFVVYLYVSKIYLEIWSLPVKLRSDVILVLTQSIEAYESSLSSQSLTWSQIASDLGLGRLDLVFLLSRMDWLFGHVMHSSIYYLDMLILIFLDTGIYYLVFHSSTNLLLLFFCFVLLWNLWGIGNTIQNFSWSRHVQPSSEWIVFWSDLWLIANIGDSLDLLEQDWLAFRPNLLFGQWCVLCNHGYLFTWSRYTYDSVVSPIYFAIFFILSHCGKISHLKCKPSAFCEHEFKKLPTTLYWIALIWLKKTCAWIIMVASLFGFAILSMLIG